MTEEQLVDNGITREEMDFDVVIVGGGPSGLSAAIRLKQLNPDFSICLLEKGSEIGSHIVSGAVIESQALEELIPQWRALNAPLHTAVTQEKILYLPNERTAFPIPMPSLFVPHMCNKGNFVVSLGDLCRWLAEQAENLGVEIYAGFTGQHLYFEDKRVCGVITGDMGRDRNGQEKPEFTPGMILRAKQVILAEGTRGSLTAQAITTFKLRENKQPQTYGLGIKEIWEIPPEDHSPGLVMHSFGWPLDNQTYGGAFLYHFGKNLVSYGFVTGLDYRNPWLSPFEEMQRTKKHSAFEKFFKNGRRISYGARAISEGGIQSLPRLSFPGGVLTGDSAGFLNMPKIKGTHTAIKSGMLAAEAVHEALTEQTIEAVSFQTRFEQSWLYPELYKARNIRPSFAKWGTMFGSIYTGIDSLLLRGHAPWTLTAPHPDHTTLRPAKNCTPIAYPKPDGHITFDRTSSVFLSGITHEENQPTHLELLNPTLWQEENEKIYASPESRYCPAGVYETENDNAGHINLRINAQNCVHCKTCDIKDPQQNIRWCPPEGGSGPNYSSGM